MIGRFIILLISLWLVAAATIHASSNSHTGPVTAICSIGPKVYSISQAGLFQGTGKAIQHIFQPPFRGIAIAEWNDQLIIAGGTPGQSGDIGIYNLANKSFRSIKVSGDLIYDISVHPDQETVALACADYNVITLPLPSLDPNQLKTFHKHTAAVRSVAYSPDGKHIASAGLDGLILLSNLNKSNSPTQIHDHTGKIECLSFSPDSTLLASGSRDGKLRIHQSDGRLLRSLSLTYNKTQTPCQQEEKVLSIHWSKDALLVGTNAGIMHQCPPDASSIKTHQTISSHPIYCIETIGTKECYGIFSRLIGR